MAAEAIDWAPHFLDVDPVYGVLFALYCERKGLRLPSLRCIVSSYEFLSLAHRHILQRVFDVPIFDLYGSTETGHLLMEDEQGEMRPSLETALFELINIDKNAIGELVLTSLTNKFMPLVRYRIGDLVKRVMHPYGTRYVVHGRIADTFILSNGRRVTTRQVDQCFIGIDGVIHYQLIQRSTTHWLLRFVPDTAGPNTEGIRILESRLQHLLENDALIKVERTDLFVPEKSGKFRLTCPALNADDQARSTG
jgi:phenylacetate-CoA ligase